MCDTIDDCPDALDENPDYCGDMGHEDNMTCAELGELSCPGYPDQCIPESWFCDNWNDCPENLDEADCTEEIAETCIG